MTVTAALMLPSVDWKEKTMCLYFSRPWCEEQEIFLCGEEEARMDFLLIEETWQINANHTLALTFR